ncbi:MAG: AAA family ATPase, partial [Desulfamplus sp.]|nr:AAA family ATPase [Desulfamplus sp.]
MLNQNIILTGFMGTGKSTVGRLVAKELNYKFVDTDELIMARCKMTVAEIFSTKGEQEFRQMEEELALELSQQDRLVISTGG